jgi:hypothetical protein
MDFHGVESFSTGSKPDGQATSNPTDMIIEVFVSKRVFMERA